MITWIQNALFIRKHHLTFKEIVKIQKIMGWNAVGTFLTIFEKCKLNIGNTSVEEFNFLTGKIYPDIKMLRFNTSWFIMNVYIRKTSNQHLKDYPCITAKKKKKPHCLFIIVNVHFPKVYVVLRTVNQKGLFYVTSCMWYNPIFKRRCN